MNPVKVAHLSWVRGPIVKYIERCKQAMVNIAGIRSRMDTPPVGASPIWFVNQKEKLDLAHEELKHLLSCISASLKVVDSNGGYTLANEVKTLASSALSDMKGSEQDKALVAIQTALNVLPSYISMVIEGAQDSPGVVLKYINEMRALREVPPLEDGSALSVNLTFGYKSPPLHESDCDLSERERVFKKAASQFCLLYAEAVKDSAESAWIEMRDIMCDLQRVTNDPQLGCNWWVGEAIIDAIIADNCYFPPALTSALRVVMVATQRLPQGEEAAKATLSPAKFSSLLNALSISRKKTSTANEVIKHFDVKQNVEEDRIEQLQEQLSTQSVKSITDVIPEIRPRLESAMFAFGRATHAKQQAGFEIQVQAFDQSMRTMANIFGIFDQAELSEVSFHLADAVKGLNSPADITAEIIETVKTQILFLDSRLINMQRNEAADHLQIHDVTPDVIDRIANETSAALKKISQMIATNVDSGVGPEKLLAALGSLRELASVYEFAGSLSIAKILAAIVQVISDEVRDGVLAETPRLVLAARAMVAVEMYLQYINSKMQPPPTLIDVANAAVAEMGLDTATFTIVSHSDLLAKFDASSSEDDGLDALLQEIFEVRPSIEEIQKTSAHPSADQLSKFAAAGLRLHAAALIKGEVKFAELCRASAQLAKIMPGRIDDPAFDSAAARTALKAASEKILRSMDEYSTKGKVMIFLVESIREVSDFLGASGSAHEAEQAMVANTTFADAPSESRVVSRLVPDGYDQHLKELFDEDFNEQIAQMRAYLDREDLVVGEHECRIVHNIHGCSLSASCGPISFLFDVLEARFFALKAKDDSLTPTQAASLSQILDGVVAFQADFPWKTETPDLPHWLAVAATLTGATSTDHDAASDADPSLDEAVAQDQHQGIVPSTVAAQPQMVVADVIDQVAVPAPAPASTPAQAPQYDSGYDLDQYDLYLCDADDVIPELQSNIQSWMSDMSNREVTADIRRNMHTLKGAAAIINAAGIRTLTHHMESLFDAMASGAINPDAHCATLTTFVVNELITMSDAVRNRQPYRILPALNDFVSEACDMCRVDGAALEEVIRSSYGQAAAQPQPEPEPVPEEAVEQTPSVVEPAPAPQALIQPEQATPALAKTHLPLSTIDSAAEELPPVAPEPVPAVQTQPDTDHRPVAPADRPSEAASEEAAGNGARSEGSSQRGYRGLRGRAFGERQKNYEAKQARKEGRAKAVSVDLEFQPAEPELTEIVTPNREISLQVQGLMQRAYESERESSQAKRKSVKDKGKIKVELQLLDNSVKLSNELKASSYRQNTLNRELQLGVIACREKLSLLVTHANKTTVQLRHFNNMSNTGTSSSTTEASDDDQRVYMERFNHISHSHTQLIAQLEQLLQDCSEIITQTTLIDSAHGYQAEVISSLQRDLIQSRLVMFENEKPNLNGALVSALQFSQKKAELQILGTDTRIDRQLLESIRDPLRHIVTNAVAHGIEHESVRVKSGKPAAGKIQVKASRRAKSLIIEVSDDGAGIDPRAIRTKAIAQGLIKADEQLNDDEILHLITESGFSTASSVSEISGRGVGMDIVRNKIVALGGHLHIQSTVGKGTAISLELPITVGSNRALVCRISDQWFAIPTFNMAQVLEYPTTELLAIKAKPGQASIMFEDKSYDVVHLADLMAVPDLKLHSAQAPSHTSLVLVEQGAIRLAIEVENGVSMPEIHVSKFEGILGGVKGIIGSTEVHDGTPALVLDVIELARLNLKMTETGYKAKLFRIRRIKRETRPLVLVVDDASSYQKLLTKHFQNMGWEVAVAHNGQDALDKLPTLSAPTLFVLDVEMPRMDGLVLTSRLRALQQFDDTPIIMLTTRANLRDKALELGVNEFLPKPYDPASLNEAVRALCPSKDVAGAA